MNPKHSHVVVSLFLCSLFIRISGIFITELIGFNPFSYGQVSGHAYRGEVWASHLLSLSTPESSIGSIDTYRWGSLLAVFWLLPGPSELYAQIGVAVMGTIGAINLYLLGSCLHSKQAGILAALPIIFFPSYFFMHSVIQREGFILFAMTSAVVLLVHPNQPISPPYNYLVALISLAGVGYVRNENYIILATIFFVVATAYTLQSTQISRQKLAGIVSVSVIGISSIVILITRTFADLSRVVDELAAYRSRRLRGRATYLEGIVPETVPELASFAGLGAVYFLFAPFPWHIETLRDIPVVVESTIALLYAFFAFFGIRVLYQKSSILAVGIVSAIILFSVGYGFGTGNYGAALRHRQHIVWAIFLLGAIGISSRIQIKI